ncbi:MAG: tetratricopeptide repeat protein [Bacteroidota bacterium]
MSPLPSADCPKYDLFVSYAHPDDADGQVHALVREIQAIQQEFERQHLQVFYDREGLRTMDDWSRRILEALKSSKVMLAVLSPAYFKSEFCRVEWEWFVDREIELSLPGEGIAGLYVVGVPGLETSASQIADPWLRNMAGRQWLDARDFWTAGPGTFRGEAVQAHLRDLVEQCVEKIKQANRALNSYSTIPPHNSNFVGRSEELRRLRTQLTERRLGAIVATRGLGGMGKSALAFEYAHAFASDYEGGRYLIESEGRADLRQVLVQNAPAFGITFTEEEQRDLAVAHQRIRRELQQRPHTLLLFDNVTNAGLLSEQAVSAYMPAGNVHALATTRLDAQRMGKHVSIIDVGALPLADAVRLLETYRATKNDDDRQAASAIAERLGGYALAIEVVAVYLSMTPEVSYADYLARLTAEGIQALDSIGAMDEVALSRHTESVLTKLLRPTFAKLTDTERFVLRLAAELPPDVVVHPWLRALVDELDLAQLPEPRPGYPDPWNALLRRLQGLRLLTLADERTSRMHRLIREVVLHEIKADADAQERVQQYLMERARKLRESEWQDRAGRWELGALAAVAAWHAQSDAPYAAELGNWLSRPLRDLGRYLEARQLLEEAIRIQKLHFETDHPTLATSYSNLALVLKALGDLTQARQLLEEAMRIENLHFEADNPDSAALYSNLATVLRALGDLPQARQLLEEAIRIQKLHFGTDHPNLAISYSNLAAVLRDLGDLTQARQFLEEAIRIENLHFETDHPNLATSYSNLAMVLWDLGDLPQAQQLLEEAIRIENLHFETDHPNLGIRYLNLAGVFHAQGDRSGACRLALQAHDLFYAKLGVDHPYTQTAQDWLDGLGC